MSYGRPGVYVEESLGMSAPSSDPSISTAVFIAAHGRGPTTPVSIEQWADFTRIYGGFPSRTSLLPYSLFNFFNNGGRNATILRLVGLNAATADRTLNDRNATVAGPQPTLQVVADNPGAWGNDILIGIADAGNTEFSLTVYLGGSNTLNVVERFEDLSMDPDAPRYVENVINSARGGSSFITVTDLFSTSTGGYGVTRPAATAPGSPVALAGGLDGDPPVAADYSNALPQLENLTQTYLLNFPGVTDDAIINSALTHCQNTGKGFLVIDPPQGNTVADVKAYVDTLQANSYGAVYYPWVHVSDPAANQPGQTRLVPPGGSVCGQIAQTDASRGVWKAPAGIAHRIAGAVGLERSFSPSELDSLHSSHVNAVRHLAGAGIVVYGARTLKRSGADKYVPIRRTMIYLRHALLETTRWAAFEPNDSLLWSDLEANISQLLTGFWQSGGLKGDTVNEAFFVRADASLNTPDVVAAGEVRVEVGVALRYPAEFIIIRLSQWEGGSGSVEVTATETL